MTRALAWISVLGVLSLESCATYKEYTCPDPIGRIVQDECDIYRTRYESLKVDLGFSWGAVGVHAKAGQESLRDPSELIQLLEHQQLSLCRDFNSCRIEVAEYRRKRDQADHIFTGVTAITEQLKNPALEREDRTRLMSELLALLTGERAKPDAEAKRIAVPERAWRRATEVFVDAVTAPPRRPQLAPGVPDIVAVRPAGDGVALSLRGYAKEDIQDDDLLELEGTTRVKCPVKRSSVARTGNARCAIGKDVREGAYTVFYRPGRDAKISSAAHGGPENAAMVRIGVLAITTATEGDRAWIAYSPDPLDALSPRAERPYLVVGNQTSSHPKVYARCQVDGKPIGGALRAADSIHGIFRHRHHIPLPFVVATAGGGEAVADRFDPARHAGRWTCSVSVDGNPSAQVTFAIERDGRVANAPLADDDALRPPWFPVSARRLP